MATKYFTRFKTEKGDHISSLTLSTEEYIELLESAVFVQYLGAMADFKYPSIYFEVERRETQFKLPKALN